MLCASYDCNSVYEERRSALRNDVIDWNVGPLLQSREIWHVPHAYHAFLPTELLVKDSRVQSVLSGVRVQLAQPLVACIGFPRLRDGAGHDRSEDRTHCPRRNRIANENLVPPFRIDQVIPILWGILRLDRVAIVADDFRREISPIPVVAR